MIKTITIRDREEVISRYLPRDEQGTQHAMPPGAQKYYEAEMADIDQSEAELDTLLDEGWREIADYPTKSGVKIVLYKKGRVSD